ncbi:MAG: PEP-CTERM sorting domain-containing protein [Verrucomicrobiales bacterium]
MKLSRLLPIAAGLTVAGSLPSHGALILKGLDLVEEGGAIGGANLATGGTAFAFDLLGGGAYPSHTIPHVNDGIFGNSNSWIGDSANSFVGVSLGAVPQTISSLAFGRDNGGEATVFTDRNLGFYTIQYTTTPNPDVDPGAAVWVDIGNLVYTGNSPAGFTASHVRHAYNFDPVEATGVRIIAPGAGLGSGTAIDELELYAAPTPNAIAPATNIATTGGIAWDGTTSRFIDGPVPTEDFLPGNGVRATNVALDGTAFGSGELGGSHLITNVNEGLYGNPHSWLQSVGATAGGEFVGITLDDAYDIGAIAFGRSNVTTGDPCGFGICQDRSIGTYTLQYSQLPGAGLATLVTGDAATGWADVGTISIADGASLPFGRHGFNLSGVQDATALRIIVSDGSLAIDELEIYAVPEPGRAAFILLGLGAMLIRRRR